MPKTTESATVINRKAPSIGKPGGFGASPIGGGVAPNIETNGNSNK